MILQNNNDFTKTILQNSNDFTETFYKNLQKTILQNNNMNFLFMSA